MPTKVIIGLQWGDEGKGKVVDNIVHNWADVCVRYQGGPNAGHTIYDDQQNKFVTHALPSGVLKDNCLNIITKGCVTNPVTLQKEIDEFKTSNKNLRISSQCPLILPHHILLDKLKYQTRIGTTAKGIGPAYSEYISRDNKTLHDLCFNLDDLKEYVSSSLLVLDKIHNDTPLNNIITKFFEENSYSTDLRSLLYTHNVRDFLKNEYFPQLEELSNFYKDYIDNTDSIIQQLYLDNKNIVLEGAQGWGLDVWGKSYPNVTSSTPNIGGVLTYTGLNHKQIDEVIGIVKAYKSKVGEGNFRTEVELYDDYNNFAYTSNVIEDVAELRLSLGEYGATTGRPRRLGYLDLDEIKEACKTNGVDTIVITRLDSLCNFLKIKLYNDNQFIEYKKWENIDNEEALNQYNLKQFTSDISKFVGIKNISFSYGPKRGQIKWQS